MPRINFGLQLRSSEKSCLVTRPNMQPREPLHDFIIRRYSSPILGMCVKPLMADG